MRTSRGPEGRQLSGQGAVSSTGAGVGETEVYLTKEAGFRNQITSGNYQSLGGYTKWSCSDKEKALAPQLPLATQATSNFGRGAGFCGSQPDDSRLRAAVALRWH